MAQQGLLVYDLTPLVGRVASEQRTITVRNVELNWRVALVMILSAPFGLILTALLAIFFGMYGLLALPITVAVAVWLFASRGQDGLMPWQRIKDKRSGTKKKGGTVGRFLVCGVEVSLSGDDWLMVQQSSVPVKSGDGA